MKSICRTFGNVILFLGIIGSIFISNSLGKVLNYESLKLERNWTLTITLFLSCALSVIVLSILLFGISEILERLEQLGGTTGIQSGASSIQFSPSASESADIVTKTSWICPTCGQENATSALKCKACNLVRPSSSLSAPTAGKKGNGKNSWTCSNCGSINSGGIEICPGCGAMKD